MMYFIIVNMHVHEVYSSLSIIHSFIHSFIHSLCQQRISKMADFYAVREEEFRLDDNLSPFNLPFLFQFSFENTREKANTR